MRLDAQSVIDRQQMRRRSTIISLPGLVILAILLTGLGLTLWHTLHVPIGLALFAAAFIHIGAAIYYATLLG